MSATANAHLQAMIEVSSNADANWVFGQVSLAAVNTTAQAGGFSGFSADTSDPVYALGQSRVSANGLAHFFSQIDNIIPASHRDYAMNLFSNLYEAGTPGSSGIYPAGIADGTIYSKSGWKPESDGSYVFNQVSRFKVGGQTYNVGIVISSGSESQDETIMTNLYKQLFSGP